MPPPTEPSTSDAPDQQPDPFDSAQQVIRSTLNTAFNVFFNPVRSACPILSSAWTPAYGNFILHPPEGTPPKSVIHFLGGAFFGAVPQQLYHTLLARLCARGHVVVATPYNLNFDYVNLAERVAHAWEAVESDLAFRYGPLPVIALGHSGGALLHAITASLFDDAAPKAGAILVSFNCRSAADAIPSYAQVVAPTARSVVAAADALPPHVVRDALDWPARFDAAVRDAPITPEALRDVLLPAATQARRFVEQVPPLFVQIARPDADTGAEWGVAEGATQGSANGGDAQGVSSGTSRRGAADGVARATAAAFAAAFGGARATDESLRDFYPPPDDVYGALRTLYPVNETLVVQFENDTLDDSPQLADALRERATHRAEEPVEDGDGVDGGGVDDNAARRRGSIDGVTYVEMSGTHLTPLAQEAPDIAAAVRSTTAELGLPGGAGVADGVMGAVGGVMGEVVSALGLRDLVKLEKVIDEWVDTNIADGRF